jgi:hypothetical protein
LSVRPSVHLSVCLSVCLSVYVALLNNFWTEWAFWWNFRSLPNSLQVIFWQILGTLGP